MTRRDSLSRVWAVAFSVAVLGTVLSPVVHGEDSFPLSTYPMFSRPKAREAVVFHVVAFSSAGRHRPVSPRLLGTDEVMQAYQTVRRAVQRRQADELCRQVAARVAEDERYADVTALEVRTDRYDILEYWNESRAPLGTRVAARCEVS